MQMSLVCLCVCARDAFLPERLGLSSRSAVNSLSVPCVPTSAGRNQHQHPNQSIVPLLEMKEQRVHSACTCCFIPTEQGGSNTEIWKLHQREQETWNLETVSKHEWFKLLILKQHFTYFSFREIRCIQTLVWQMWNITEPINQSTSLHNTSKAMVVMQLCVINVHLLHHYDDSLDNSQNHQFYDNLSVIFFL